MHPGVAPESRAPPWRARRGGRRLVRAPPHRPRRYRTR